MNVYIVEIVILIPEQYGSNNVTRLTAADGGRRSVTDSTAPLPSPSVASTLAPLMATSILLSLGK